MSTIQKHGPVFQAVYITIEKNHPAYWRLDEDEERMVSAEDWTSDCEGEGIDPNLPEEVTDVIIAKAD